MYRPVLEPLGLTHPQYLVRLDPGTLSPLSKRLEAGSTPPRPEPRGPAELALSLTEVIAAAQQAPSGTRHAPDGEPATGVARERVTRPL